MKNKKGFTSIELVFTLMLLFLLGVGSLGWILNVIKFCKCDFKAPYKAEVIHAIGVVTPICIVTGYIDLGK